MKNLIQLFKKNLRSILVVSGFILAFTAGFLFQSFNSSAKNVANSMASYAAGALPQGTAPTVCGLAQLPANDEIRGQFVTSGDYNNATNAFEAAHPESASTTWGGIIGKEYLIAIINSLSSTQNNVRFSFATESNQKTSIYFVGGTNDPVTGKAGSYNLYLKTGSSLDTYCPTHCQN